jgi:hypothetical protein
MATDVNAAATLRPQINPSRMGNQGDNTNLNFPQPYYQVHAYGPGTQPIPDSFFPKPPMTSSATREVYPGISENMREQVARTLREFGLELKGRARTYQKPYSEFFDTIPYPRGFRVSDFGKFTCEDSKTTYEHIGQFLAQVSDFGITDVHKIMLFLLSLSGTTFNWFISLAPNTVNTWENLEQKFHDYFYNGETEIRLSHLAAIKQKHNESIAEYVRRFRDTRNKCYTLTMTERDLAELVFSGLIHSIKDKLERQNFL